MMIQPGLCARGSKFHPNARHTVATSSSLQASLMFTPKQVPKSQEFSVYTPAWTFTI
jgi:hypothetical protein